LTNTTASSRAVPLEDEKFHGERGDVSPCEERARKKPAYIAIVKAKNPGQMKIICRVLDGREKIEIRLCLGKNRGNEIMNKN
jgi:hypothetical protein